MLDFSNKERVQGTRADQARTRGPPHNLHNRVLLEAKSHSAWTPAPLPYISRRPSIAFHMVTSSANSMSLPTGMPMAMRVTFTPSGFSSFER